MNFAVTNAVLDEVANERAKQDRKWGVQTHPASTWLTILTEEVGELAQAILEAGAGDPKDLSDMRTEAIQSAAVAVAIVEAIDAGRCSPARE